MHHELSGRRIASPARSIRVASQQSHPTPRSATSIRSEYTAASPPELNPYRPRQARRRYAVEPIHPRARVHSSSAVGISNSSNSIGDDVSGQPPQSPTVTATSEQELRLLEEVARQHEASRLSRDRGSSREMEERQRDWEREQYYIRLNAEARRVNQQYDGQPRSSHYHPSYHAYQHQSQQQAAAQAQSPQPREPQHKVYLLNCKHCGNFLSDRGMKAVLLLKPNITLFSTDAIPTTCGPFFPSNSFNGGVDSHEPPVERTCECLTQSLGCYGCGAQVGYSIVAPCSRCTNSVAKHQRSSNGHRTVLHCSEITVRERRYVPGEPGVLASPPSPDSPVLGVGSILMASPRSLRSGSSSGTLRSDSMAEYYDLEEEDEEDLEAEKSEAAYNFYQQQQQPALSDDAPNRQMQYHRDGVAGSKVRRGRVMRRGDTVYWSDLVMGGERAAPFDPDPILNRPIIGR